MRREIQSQRTGKETMLVSDDGEDWPVLVCITGGGEGAVIESELGTYNSSNKAEKCASWLASSSPMLPCSLYHQYPIAKF